MREQPSTCASRICASSRAPAIPASVKRWVVQSSTPSVVHATPPYSISLASAGGVARADDDGIGVVDAGGSGHDQRADGSQRAAGVAGGERRGGIDAGGGDRIPGRAVDPGAGGRWAIRRRRTIDAVGADDERAARRAAE